MQNKMDHNAMDEIEKLRQSLHILKTSISALADEIIEDDEFDYFIRNLLTYSMGLAGAIELKLKDLVYSEFMKGNLDKFFTNDSELSTNFMRKMI